MSDEITGALIGAGAAGLTLLIQSILAPVVAKIFKSREQKRDILERYAPALGSSAEGLYYRLTEIVTSGRHAYLHTESKPTSYHVYKFNSSVYRLAKLIGWIWAIRTEQSLLAEVTDKKYSLHEVFSQFEFALANGDEVESWMVKELASLWGFVAPDEAAAGRLGAHLDSFVDNISPPHVVRRSEICALPHDQQTAMLVEVASYFARELGEICPTAHSHQHHRASGLQNLICSTGMDLPRLAIGNRRDDYGSSRDRDTDLRRKGLRNV